MNRSGSLLFLIFFVLVAGGGVWAWQFMHGPEYSLVHAVHAANTRDLAEFRSYVDIPRLANSLTNQTIARNTNELFGKPATSGILGSLGRSLANTVADAAKPMMRSETEQTIIEGIEQGSIAMPSQMDGFQGAITTFVLRRNPEFQVKDISQRDQLTRIKAVVAPGKIRQTSGPKVVVLFLEQNQGRWHLVGADLGQ